MIKFHCSSCDKKIGVPDEFAGQKVRCPRCSQAIRVPETAADDEPVLDVPEGDSIWSDDLLADSQPTDAAVAETGESAVKQLSCPACATPAAAGAELCLQCGHSLQPTVAGGPVGVTSTRFGLALGGSFAGAALGGLIWAAIVCVTGYELGFVAWGIGILAGLGAAVLTAERSGRLMVAVGAMAVVGVIIGKLIIFSWMAAPELEAALMAEMAPDDLVASTLANPKSMFHRACYELVKQGELDVVLAAKVRETFNSEDLSTLPEEVAAGRERVLQALDEWTDEQKEAMVMATLRDGAGLMSKAILSQFGLIERIKMSLTFWDGLWCLLAVGSACKCVASEGESKQ